MLNRQIYLHGGAARMKNRPLASPHEHQECSLWPNGQFVQKSAAYKIKKEMNNFKIEPAFRKWTNMLNFLEALRAPL